MDLKEIAILGSDIKSHWYYMSKAKAVKRLLSKKAISSILDIGSGSGFFSHMLLSETSAKEAWCIDISYETEFDASVEGKPVHYRREIDSVSADTVLLMDVLEHVEDDIGLLRDYALKVPKGAHFLISVPAFQFLWSGHDVFLDHKRRYRISQIEKVVNEAGLEVIHSAYYFGGVFPIAAGIRLASKCLKNKKTNPRSQLAVHTPFVNRLLATISSAELPFISLNRLAGLTVFCFAKKV